MDFKTFLSKKAAKTLRTDELFDRDIMRVACGQHLNTTMARFKLGGARNLASIGPRWLSLIGDATLFRTSQEALTAWKAASDVGIPQTRHFLEAGATGRMVLVTSVPWLDEQRFLRTLPDRSYLAFILPYRRIFYGFQNWKQREFAHWIFTAGPDEQGYEEISVSLFYMESYESLALDVGRQMHERPGSSNFFEGRAAIVPTTYLPRESGTDLLRELLRLDAQATRS